MKSIVKEKTIQGDVGDPDEPISAMRVTHTYSFAPGLYEPLFYVNIHYGCYDLPLALTKKSLIMLATEIGDQVYDTDNRRNGQSHILPCRGECCDAVSLHFS